MKKNVLLLFLLLFLIPVKVDAENLTPSVDNEIKIFDYADLLTATEEKMLETSITHFIEIEDLDMVIVTIDTNPYGVSDYYTEKYAEDFYLKNAYGKGNSNSGMIILLDMSNRYCFIKLFGSAVEFYSDNAIERMHDNAIDYVADGDYYEAFDSYIDDAYIYKNYDPYIGGDYDTPKRSVNLFWSLFLAVLVSSITLSVHIKKYKGIKLATNANAYLGNINITEKQDHFLTTFTTRVAIPHNNSGGSSGRSSSSHSSSSHSGGGGRHF